MNEAGNSAAMNDCRMLLGTCKAALKILPVDELPDACIQEICQASQTVCSTNEGDIVI